MSDSTTPEQPAAVPFVPDTNVIISVQHELQRFGIERMLQSLGPQVRPTINPCLRESIEIVMNDDAAVLIVASRDLEGVTEAKVRRAIKDGAKVLLLFGRKELSKTRWLASIRGYGYLCAEDLSIRTLANALVRVREGEVPIPANLAMNLLTMVSESPQRTTGTVRVTPRERQVLVLLVDGLSNKQIARQLGISEHGAKRLVASLMAKMDCPTRTLVVAKALREGLIHPGSQDSIAG